MGFSGKVKFKNLKGGITMLNQCVLSGNLGHDPETRYYGDSQDQPVTSFSLAFRASRARTGWIRVVCFQRLAEVAEQYLHQGARVAVMGTLDQMEWEGEEGQKRNGFQLIAQTLEFIKINERGSEEEQPAVDLPF
jgi:single-strand DNA-binding protein